MHNSDRQVLLTLSGDQLMIDFHYQHVGEKQDIVSVALSGSLDGDSSEYLLECVEQQIVDGYKKLILNCDELTFISSLGLGMLIRVRSRMKKAGGDVKVAALGGMVAKVFRVVGLDRVFQFYPTVEDAVAAHGG